MNYQKIFLNGKLPTNLDGFYKGTVPGHIFSWKGKSFNLSTSTGINKIENKGNLVDLYPFKTYSGAGIIDKNLSVLKIDYDIPQNPFWLRHILDELVQVGSNQYLGKVHIKVFPFLTFSVGYFKLEK